MANDVKRMDTPPRRPVGALEKRPTAPARLTLLACVAALAVLLTQLPGPVEVLGVLTGTASPTTASAPLAAVQDILLITAGLLAWLLAAWAVVVLGIGLLARLPGRPGRRARRLLPRIAPASVGRLVLAAVGVSLIAGTAACAVPAASSTPGAAGTAATAGPASGATAGVPTAPPTGSISIDWPEPNPPTVGSTSSASTASTPPAVTFSPPAPSPTSGPAAPVSAPVSTPVSTPAAGSTGAPTSVDPAPAAPEGQTAPPTTPSPATPSPAASSVAASAPAAPTPTAAEPSAAPTTGTSAGTAPAGSAPAAAPTGPAPASGTGPSPATGIDAAKPDSPGAVTVQPGESLWRIAARTMGPDATDNQIDNAWRAWYFVNREVIGDDPDIILPGQSLVAPTATEQGRP